MLWVLSAVVLWKTWGTVPATILAACLALIAGVEIWFRVTIIALAARYGNEGIPPTVERSLKSRTQSIGLLCGCMNSVAWLALLVTFIGRTLRWW